MTEHAASPWLALKLAQELYGKSPKALTPNENRRVAEVSRRQAEIERRILATAEAAGVILPDEIIERTLAGIRARYPDEEDFLASLARADLSPDSLRSAVERDLIVEAVLEHVAGRIEPISASEVEIFYLQHVERFTKPETRTLRHILVTINDAVPGSARAEAQAKIAQIHARLAKDIARFGEQALKHSECPTAMQGGLLGTLPRGKLYAELDAVAFALAAGELSDVVESPLGFHLLLCESIHPARAIPLAEAHERVRAYLADTRRQAAQRAWIKELLK